MADFTYTKALNKAIDYVNDDIRVAIVMSMTTVEDEEDAEFLDDFSTLDEYDGSGYSRQALAGQLWDADTTNDRGKFTSDPVVFSSLGAGTRPGYALLFYKHVGADSANIPLFFKQPSGFPFTGNGEDITINPHTDGWAYLKNGS